jgi:hypothetical protein
MLVGGCKPRETPTGNIVSRFDDRLVDFEAANPTCLPTMERRVEGGVELNLGHFGATSRVSVLL